MKYWRDQTCSSTADVAALMIFLECGKIHRCSFNLTSETIKQPGTCLSSIWFESFCWSFLLFKMTSFHFKQTQSWLFTCGAVFFLHRLLFFAWFLLLLLFFLFPITVLLFRTSCARQKKKALHSIVLGVSWQWSLFMSLLNETSCYLRQSRVLNGFSERSCFRWRTVRVAVRVSVRAFQKTHKLLDDQESNDSTKNPQTHRHHVVVVVPYSDRHRMHKGTKSHQGSIWSFRQKKNPLICVVRVD